MIAIDAAKVLFRTSTLIKVNIFRRYWSICTSNPHPSPLVMSQSPQTKRKQTCSTTSYCGACFLWKYCSYSKLHWQTYQYVLQLSSGSNSPEDQLRGDFKVENLV